MNSCYWPSTVHIFDIVQIFILSDSIINLAVTITGPGTKCTVENSQSEIAIEFLNNVIEASNILEYNELRMVKLPEIRDFKFPNKKKNMMKNKISNARK